MYSRKQLALFELFNVVAYLFVQLVFHFRVFDPSQLVVQFIYQPVSALVQLFERGKQLPSRRQNDLPLPFQRTLITHAKRPDRIDLVVKPLNAQWVVKGRRKNVDDPAADTKFSFSLNHVHPTVAGFDQLTGYILHLDLMSLGQSDVSRTEHIERN